MRFTALDDDGRELQRRGLLLGRRRLRGRTSAAIGADRIKPDDDAAAYPFTTGAELLRLCRDARALDQRS